jgi:hypothetical protein
LSVNGGMTSDASSTILGNIISAGTTAGTDYSQIVATGTLNIGGAHLTLVGGTSGTCPTLNVGDGDTIAQTTGSVVGTFNGIPDGSVIPLSCSGTAPTVRINYTAHTVTATVVTAGGSTLPLTVTKGGSGSGTVTSNDGAINCGVTCLANYAPGTVVTLTATPDAGATFAGWSGGGCSGTGTCVVTMNAAQTVTAAFDAASVVLAVAKTGAGAGTVTSSDGGINCGGTCSANYAAGTQVTVSASATAGSTFAGWSGGGCSGTGTCVVTMSTAQNLAATFNAFPAANPANSSPPVISGTTTVGQRLTTSTGVWSGTEPISYSYQWARCGSSCSAITGATGSSYTLTSAELGVKIAVAVTASNSAGSAQAVASAVGPVAAAGPSSVQVKAALSKVLKPSGKAAKLKAIVKAGGYSVSFTAPSGGKLVINWFATVKGKQVLVAAANVVFRQSGKTTVKLKLTGKGRKLLKAGKSVKITTKATFTATGGTPTTSSKTTTLKP